MAKIVEGPKPRHVSCETCEAVIEYLPEEVETRNGQFMGETDGWKRVKCPRLIAPPSASQPQLVCAGYGYIERW